MPMEIGGYAALGPGVFKAPQAGGRVDAMTLAALVKATEFVQHTYPTFFTVVTQACGPGSRPGVHADSKGGVVDLRAVGHDETAHLVYLYALDKAGFATKDLGPSSAGVGPGRAAGFDRHVHAVLATHPDLSKDALAQVEAYHDRPDLTPDRANPALPPGEEVGIGDVRLYRGKP